MVGAATATVANAARTQNSFFMFRLLSLVTLGGNGRPMAAFLELLWNFLEPTFTMMSKASNAQFARLCTAPAPKACPGEVESGSPTRTCGNTGIYGVFRSYGITESSHMNGKRCRQVTNKQLSR